MRTLQHDSFSLLSFYRSLICADCEAEISQMMSLCECVYQSVVCDYQSCVCEHVCEVVSLCALCASVGVSTSKLSA